MNPLMQTVITILGGILISVVTSYITVQLSLRQFYSQKWWERKADAYSALIEALYHVKNYMQKDLEQEAGFLELTTEEKIVLSGKLRQANEELWKAESIGVFVISKGAAQSLTKLRVQHNIEEEKWMTGADANDYLSAVNKCLEEIINYAKRDLYIK
jgi:hypothetical protein